MDSGGAGENVWFVPSGTGYSTVQSSRADARRPEMAPNPAINLPPRDYEGAPKPHEGQTK